MNIAAIQMGFLMIPFEQVQKTTYFSQNSGDCDIFNQFINVLKLVYFSLKVNPYHLDPSILVTMVIS